MIHEYDPLNDSVDEPLLAGVERLILNAILAESQIYNGQWLMPMYVEPQVSIADLECAGEELKLVRMFGGNR
jgi:hypothetical protein